MKVRIIIFWICFILLSLGSCAVQKKSKPICFNHSLLVLDSVTYNAAVNSEFINKHFAFSHEKQLIGYHGFYLIGKTTYIELFHPKSVEGTVEEKGTIWICLVSLKANYLEKLNEEKLDFIEFGSDEDYNNLSLMIGDSIYPFTTWEMKKVQYESWTKKEYNDSMEFLPVDYNSQEESDSSSNYLMDDVKGIGLSLNADDSLKVIRYLEEIGYDSVSEYNGHLRLSKNDQFIELHILKEAVSMTINRYYIRLNKKVERHIEIIGNSRIECDGKTAIWFFEYEL